MLLNFRWAAHWTALMLFVLGLLLPAAPVSAGGEPPQSELALAMSTALPVPEAQGELDYLGLAGEAATFALEDLQSRCLVVQIFSSFCPHCQAEAPTVNQAFAEFAKLDAKRVRFLALGANNTEFEVGLFRKRYETTYPMTPDPDMTVAMGLGAQVTPTYYILDMRKTPAKVLLKHEGAMEADELVEAALKHCKP